MEIKENMSVLDLIEEMGKSGVLGAGRVSKATQLFADSIKDEDTSIFFKCCRPSGTRGTSKNNFLIL